jgi:F420 biosynthesis protein FbiB-like protein
MPINPEELHNFLRTRRSIRRFKLDPVPAEVVERMIKTATYAPSAHNLQPWRFVVVMTQIAKARFGKALTNAMRVDMISEGAKETDIQRRVTNTLNRLNEAPVVILLCRDVTAVREHKPEDTIMSIQSVANAGLQLLLAAHAEGLGGNWICWPLYAQAETQKVLDLTDSWEPQAMYLIGYPIENPFQKEKRASDVVFKK